MATPNFERMRRLSADIRIHTVEALCEAGFGHIGGSASIADVLGVLYGGAMDVRPDDPGWDGRDRLVLSKGHSGPALYAALALRGFFPINWLKTVNKPGTRLPSHADMIRTPGVDMSTGSLGQGISAAVGMALAARVRGEHWYTYCIVGDGETNEGEVWEAMQSAAHFALNRLIIFVDWNKKQLDGTLEQVCEPHDLQQKLTTFGLDARVVRGYDTREIYGAIEAAKADADRCHAIILDTIKGMGVSFAERADFNHYMNIDRAMADEAITEINRRYAADCYPGGEALC